MLCYFLAYSKVIQLYIYIYSFSDSFPLSVITIYLIQFPVLYSKTSVHIYMVVSIFSYGMIFYGEGNGNPLQYSCLKSLMDRGAWQATVHDVVNSWTRLNH